MKSILSQEALRQIAASHPPDAQPIVRSTPNTCVSVTGQALNSLGTAAIQLCFSGSTVAYDCDFLICDNMLEPLECILGWDFIRANSLQLTVSDASYFLVGPHGSTPLTPVSKHLGPHSCQISTTASSLSTPDPPSRLTQSSTQGPAAVVLASNITLPPRTECIIQGLVPKSYANHLGMVCNLGDLVEMQFCTAHTISQADQRKLPVRIMNVSKSPVELHAGEKIASFSPVFEEPSAILPAPDICCGIRSPSEISKTTASELASAISPNLSELDREKLLQTLLSFPDVFQSSLGHTTVVEHRIDTGDSTPIRQYPRRLPHHYRAEVDRQVNEMLSQGVVQPSNSPWASPIVLVKKKDGSYRFCVDYRKLNLITKPDAHPLPRVDDLLDALNGYKMFSTLDLRNGYWQVSMSGEDREKTAFITPSGLFEFNRMPFGLSNAPATFSRAIGIVLSGLTYEQCLCYFDDVIVFSKDIDQHCQRLQAVLTRFREQNLRVKASKCSFGADRVLYLGHTVSSEGIHTDPSKIEAVQNLQSPRSLDQLRTFLGLAGYYRKFIPGFATIATPLTELTQRSAKFVWLEKHQQAFLSLKNYLCSAPILAYPQFTKPFIVQTDASDVGLGAILAQIDDEGKERVIAYASRTLSRRERNYSAMEKEALAVVFAVQHFRFYLLGHKFCVVTDNSALRWLHSVEPKGRIARWVMTLQEYNFTIKHRPGSLNQNADALSRLNHPIASIEETGTDQNFLTCLVSLLPDTNLFDAQRNDPNVCKVIEMKHLGFPKPPFFVWKDNPYLRSLWNCWDELYVSNGLLLRSVARHKRLPRNLLVLPQSLISNVIKNLHCSPSGGHMGVTRTVLRAKHRFFWPNMQETVQNFIQVCPECSKSKPNTLQNRAPMQPIPVGEPFVFWALDYMGPLKETSKGNRHILVLMDHFTKWCEAFPTKDQKASTVASTLVSRVFSRFGPPTILHSDQGRNFDSLLMHEIYNQMGIKKTRTTAYHPQCDGLVERQNRTLQEIISSFVSDHSNDWDEVLDQAVFAYNTSTHESTGLSPYEMVFGREARMPVEVELGVPLHNPSSQSEYSQLIRKAIQKANDIARSKLGVVRDKQAKRYDNKNTRKWKPFEVGQTVWLWRPKHWKFGSRWVGPYKIAGRQGVNYTLMLREGKTLVAHHNQLKIGLATSELGLPIHPVAETPGIPVQEYDTPPPEAPIQARNEPTRPRPQRLRQFINPPVRYGEFLAH